MAQQVTGKGRAVKKGAVQAPQQARGRGRPRKAEPPRRAGGPERKELKSAPREEILKVAARLFSLKGYAGTTMAEIADVVGIRSPSLYYHFKDKPDILGAITDIILDEAISDSQKLLKSRDEPVVRKLYRLVRELVYRLRSSPYELNCMFDPAFHGDEFHKVNRKLFAWMGDMEQLIRQGIEGGAFTPQNLKVASYTVRGLIESAIRQLGGYPESKMTPRQYADYVATFAIKGLLADQSLLAGACAD
jgi:AcrR family transcriptional regulator